MAGPYYVASAGDGQVVVEKNPGYRGGRPRRVERIVYTGDITAADAVARVQRDGADYVSGDILGFDPAGPLVPGGSVDRSYGPGSRAGRAGRARYVASPGPGLDGIAFNTRRPLFRDARMRRAVGYALDRTALAAVYGEQPSDHLIPPALSGIAGNVAYPNDPDLTTARRLAGPGRRTARLYGCGDPIGVRIARIVRANLAPIGIDVQIDQSLGCLKGPEPERLAAADMQLVSHADHSHDPVSFVELPLGDRFTAPGYWRSASLAAAHGERPGPSRPREGPRVRRAGDGPRARRRTRRGLRDLGERRSSSRGASAAGSPRVRSRRSISEPSAWADGHPPPARLHVNLVSRSRGARPPGRAPRCTMSVGVPVARRARRVAPSPSRRHRGESPTHHRPARPCGRHHAAGPRVREHGVHVHADDPLDGDGRRREEPAGVAGTVAPAAPGADQPQRATGSGGEPGPQLGCGPVVVATAEEHGDPALEGRRRRSGEQRHVARRALEHEGDRVGHRAVPRQVLRGIDHRQVGLVRQRQTAPCRFRGNGRRRRRPGT